VVYKLLKLILKLMLPGMSLWLWSTRCWRLTMGSSCWKLCHKAAWQLIFLVWKNFILQACNQYFHSCWVHGTGLLTLVEHGLALVDILLGWVLI